MVYVMVVEGLKGLGKFWESENERGRDDLGILSLEMVSSSTPTT